MLTVSSFKRKGNCVRVTTKREAIKQHTQNNFLLRKTPKKASCDVLKCSSSPCLILELETRLLSLTRRKKTKLKAISSSFVVPLHETQAQRRSSIISRLLSRLSSGKKTTNNAGRRRKTGRSGRRLHKLLVDHTNASRF